MIKPRYFSVKCNFGEKRGFFFIVVALVWLSLFPVLLHAQTQPIVQKTTWILMFGSDTLILHKPLPVADIQEAAYKEAWYHGYFQSELIKASSDRDTLRAYFLGNVRFKWADKPIKFASETANEKWQCHFTGRHYAASDLEVCIDNHVDLLARSGYYQPTIVIDSLLIDYEEYAVSALISISLGEIARLTEVTWLGLTKTGSKWLENAVGITAGVVLSESNLRRISSKLYQTKLFDDISPPEIYLTGDKWGLLYTVNERPLTFFDLLVGYVPDQSGKAVVAGTGLLNVRNAGFDGTELTLDVNRQSARVGRLLIALNQNMLLGYPFGITSTFSLIRQDTLWQNRTTAIGVWWDAHDHLRIHTALNREVSASSSTSQGSADLWGTYGQMGITFDTRNDADLRSAGLLLHLMVESGRQIVEPLATERYNHIRRRVMGNVDLHIPIKQRNVLIPGVTSGTIISERRLFSNDLWRIGGTKSLRGYREDQFFASSYLWGDLEYRFLLDPYSYLFAFASSGWIWLPEADGMFDSTERKNVGSFGFGLAYRTNLGQLKFTYAKSPEDPFSNAKVHIGIASGF
jgi:outer membrane protein assembly factor BamA